MYQEPVWKVYLVECQDKSLYCGITIDLDLRVKMHNVGKASKYTRSRTPVKLKWHSICKNESDARRREIKIKAMTKEQKQFLIQGGVK